MSCPTCDHTMYGIGEGRYHCPRCGTIDGCYADGAAFVPALVDRCRQFEKYISPDQDAMLLSRWEGLGIAESINTPENRG